jgi:hypothetical protein
VVTGGLIVLRNVATALKDIRTRHDADKEGWDIFESSDDGLEIQAIDGAGVFKDDSEATQHVIEAAKGGNVNALRAMVVLLAHIAEPVIDGAIRIQTRSGKVQRLATYMVTIPEPSCSTASMATY